MEKNYSYFRILDKETGLFLQRNGYFGKLARMYPTLGQLSLSILENDIFKNENTDNLVIQEIKVVVANELNFNEYKEQAKFRREQKEEKQRKENIEWRKKQLEEELAQLNK